MHYNICYIIVINTKFKYSKRDISTILAILAELAMIMIAMMMFNIIFASIKPPRSERCHLFSKTGDINVVIIPNPSLLIIMNHEAV